MDALAGLLGRWVARQRWYAGKGRMPQLRRVGDLLLDSDDREARVRVLLVVDDADPRQPVYQVPIVERRESPPHSEAHLIGTLDRRLIFDGPHDAAYASAVLAAVGGQARVTDATVLTGEQSNTSIIVGTESDSGSDSGAGRGELMIKVFRVAQFGKNPDVELQGELSAAGVPFVPRFTGAIEAEWIDGSGTAGTGHLAIAQEFLRGAEDAWRTATRAVNTGQDFTREALELGHDCAVVHGVLAARLPTTEATPAAVTAIADLWQERLDRAILDVPELASSRDAIEAVYAAARTSSWPVLQRIHGDLHLGQILRLGGHDGHDGRWVFIDFEGEPLRAISERTEPEPALRDVAGMLRSFAYAAASVNDSGEGPSPEAERWAEDCRRAFLAGYSGADHAGDVDEALLRDPLLAAFELDKAVYEASYEARNRPTWLPIPLGGIARLIAVPASNRAPAPN